MEENKYFSQEEIAESLTKLDEFTKSDEEMRKAYAIVLLLLHHLMTNVEELAKGIEEITSKFNDILGEQDDE